MVRQFRGRKAIGWSRFDTKLKIMDRIARSLPEAAIDFPMIKPEFFQQALYLRLLRPA